MKVLTLFTLLVLSGTWQAPFNPAYGAEIQQLPVWRSLEFEKVAYGVVAKSLVSLHEDPDQGGFWKVTADSSVAGSQESITIQVEPQSGRAYHRTRLSEGSGKRFKSYEYLPDYVLRERRSPTTVSDKEPDRWELTSRRKIVYPRSRKVSDVITDAYVLLLLCSEFQQGIKQTDEVIVHTDLNFYRVRFSRGEIQWTTVDFLLQPSAERIAGPREVHPVILKVYLIGEPEDDPDFSLMGLEDNISVLFDSLTGLPVQLNGDAPRIGYTSIKLKSAILNGRDISS